MSRFSFSYLEKKCIIFLSLVEYLKLEFIILKNDFFKIDVIMKFEKLKD